jgi:putative hemolysin
MALLFRGIAEYMNQSQAKTLFGCSSVKVHQPREAALIFAHLKQQDYALSQSSVSPTPAYRMPHIDFWHHRFSNGLSETEQSEAEALVPSLVKMYLKMGAKIVCEPAFDEEFNCIDLLTVLKTQDLEASLAKRFQVINGVKA